MGSAIPVDGAITHDARLWWVDLSGGLLTCNPFADHPVLRFIPLPKANSSLPSCSHGIHRCRCVKLRFLYIDRRAAKVTMWTLLPNPDHDLEEDHWVLEHHLSFQHLRADDSYRAAGLREDANPVLAFVHPTNPDVVYFFLGDHLVGVHMRDVKVVDCDVCHLLLPPIEFVSSGFVIACQLSPSIATSTAAAAVSGDGLPGKHTDTSVAEESTSQLAVSLRDQII